ncbi:hypothetical protein SNK04_014389 [Fusarium graminearum]
MRWPSTAVPRAVRQGRQGREHPVQGSPLRPAQALHGQNQSVGETGYSATAEEADAYTANADGGANGALCAASRSGMRRATPF